MTPCFYDAMCDGINHNHKRHFLLSTNVEIITVINLDSLKSSPCNSKDTSDNSVHPLGRLNPLGSMGLCNR